MYGRSYCITHTAHVIQHPLHSTPHYSHVDARLSSAGTERHSRDSTTISRCALHAMGDAQGGKDVPNGVSEKHDEMEALRAQLKAARADAEKRTEQLEAAKEKAKALIRLQQERAKGDKQRLESENKAKQQTIDDLTKRITELVPPPGSSVQSDLQEKVEAQEKTITDLLNRIKELVPPPDDKAASPPAKQRPPSAASTSKHPPAQKIAVIRERILKLAGETNKQVVAEVAEECEQIEADVVALADDFLAAKTALGLAEQDGQSATRYAGEARSETRALRAKLAAAEKSVAEARAQVKKLEKQTAAPSAPTPNSKELTQLRDEKAALDVKLAGMDAILTEKNTELNKVREKARVYLKQINADKRAAEQRMKGEVDSLKEKLDGMKTLVANAEKNAKAQDAELENCLSLVSEKQKTIQSLNMALSTERGAVANSAKQLLQLREEFAKYKERARVALEERDSRLHKSDTAVETATEELRTELEQVRGQLAETRRQLATAKKHNADAKFNLERAIRAETALELQRSSASTESSVQIANLRKMERQVEMAEERLADVRTRAEEAESRVESLTSRLSSVNQKLTDAVQDAAAKEKVSELELNRLREKVSLLQTQLVKSNSSATAAHRVAAVAARALSSSPLPGATADRASTSLDMTPRVSPAVSHLALSPLLKGARSHDEGLSRFNSGSLQKVMASHSHSMGLSSPRSTAGESDDAAFRENQVAVLTSQLSELSTLLDDSQEEAKTREQQNSLLKSEVKRLEQQLGAAQKLHDGAPFNYLRSVVMSYLENPDNALLPVLADVLAISKDELDRIKGRPPRAPSGGGGRVLSFLGRR